jgi:uncharacterized protein with PIN domain
MREIKFRAWINSAISWIEGEEEGLSFEEMVENDEVFIMSPKNSFNIRLNIQSIEKPKPKFVEPY